MSLLQEIQEAVVKENSDISSIFLKLRLLASRLGSNLLEDWVKYETEGYPKNIQIPSYRYVSITYHGTFSGPFGSGIRNAPIPSQLVQKFAGENWINYEVRDSIAVVDDLLKSHKDNNSELGVDVSNLILILQGKIYSGYACNDIQARISPSSFVNIQYAVKSKILELTLELEKKIPVASLVTFGSSNRKNIKPEVVQQISQQIIYGNVDTAIAGGHSSNINISIGERDTDSLIKYLVESGIPDDDANEIAKIMETEEPESFKEPFGEKAKNWITTNIKKAALGTWKIGISVTTDVLSEAAKKYYGFK